MCLTFETLISVISKESFEHVSLPGQSLTGSCTMFIIQQSCVKVFYTIWLSLVIVILPKSILCCLVYIYVLTKNNFSWHWLDEQQIGILVCADLGWYLQSNNLMKIVHLNDCNNFNNVWVLCWCLVVNLLLKKYDCFTEWKKNWRMSSTKREILMKRTILRWILAFTSILLAVIYVNANDYFACHADILKAKMWHFAFENENLANNVSPYVTAKPIEHFGIN